MLARGSRTGAQFCWGALDSLQRVYLTLSHQSARKLGYLPTNFLPSWAEGCSCAWAKNARAKEYPDAQRGWKPLAWMGPVCK